MSSGLANTPVSKPGVQSRAMKKKMASEAKRMAAEAKLKALQTPRPGEPNIIYDKSDLEGVYDLDADDASDMELAKFMKSE